MDHDRAGGPLAMSSSASVSPGASASSPPRHHHPHHHQQHHHQPQRQPPQPHHPPAAPSAAHREYPTTIGSSREGSGESGSNSPSSTLVYEGRSSSQHPSFDSTMSASRKSSSDLMTKQQQQAEGAEGSSSSQQQQQRYAEYATGGRPPNGQPGASASYPHASMQQQLHASHLQQQQQQQQQRPSASPSLMSLQPARPPLRSRVFGLGRDLRPQEDLVDPAYFPGGVVPAEAVTLLGTGADPKTKQWPNFSVELSAPTFDERGYPVYSGRGAIIKGDIRIRRSDVADVKIKISAHTTSGSAAAVWDGVALQPPESGSERTVFQIAEMVRFEEGRIQTPQQRDPQAPSPTSETSEGANAVHVIPFTVNLPVGGNTRMVDGNVETVAVALPPSFEMSSEQDAKEKAVLRNTAGGGSSGSGAGSGGMMPGSSAASIKTSRTKMTALTIKDAVETGLQQVYRIGCFYRITFELKRRETSSERPRKVSTPFFGKGKKSGGTSGDSSQGAPSSSSSSTSFPGPAGKKGKGKGKGGSDTISIPFVFLGEPTQMQPPPSSLPPLRLSILTTPSVPLARGWESEVVTAKWSGMLLKALKRGVELELFLPEGKVIQAPSVIPVLLVIRPEDPELLPQPCSATSPLLGSPSRSHPGSPRLSSVVSRADDGTFEQQHPAPPQRSVSGTVPTRSSLAAHAFPDVEDEEQEHLDDGGAIGASPSQATNVGSSSSSSSNQTGGNSLSRLIRSSLSLSRQPTIDAGASTGARPSMDSNSGAVTPGGSSSSAHGPSSPQASQKQLKKKSSRPSFAFHRARPSTAPSTAGSDESRAGTEASYTVRGGAHGGAGSSSSSSGTAVDLPALVRVSLLQTVFYSSSSVNETPKNKRRLVSVADLEEVDFAALVNGAAAARAGDGAIPQANSDAMLQVEEAKRRGVRVLRGLLRVGREATPSFRVQGIELKYAIKVDLQPFNPRPKGARSAGSGSGSQQQQQHAGSSAASSSTSPPRTPPGGASGRPSIHSAYAPSVRGQPQQAHNPSFSMSSSSSSQWSPSKHHGYPHSHHAPHHLPQHLQHQQGYYDPAAASSAAISSTSGNSGGASSVYGPAGGGAMAGSEAGWTKRSPSDQTVMGPEMAKLSKTVGALWINVRLVKGRGSL